MERRELKIDWLTVLLYALLVLFGWLNIYAASTKDAAVSPLNLDFTGGKQFLWIAVASVVGIVILRFINAKFIEFSAYAAYAGVVLLLLFVLVFGREVNGARSWFEIGPFRVQPAEFAKLATALALAKFMSRVNFSLRNNTDRLICAGLIAAPAGLILLQPDVGTAIVFGGFLIMFFREGLNYQYLLFAIVFLVLSVLALVANKVLLIIGILAAGFVSVYFIYRLRYLALHVALVLLLGSYVWFLNDIINATLKEHHRNRIAVLFNPEIDKKDIGYNLMQSKIAIGSGGLTGKGFMQGTQTKYDFVPEQETDYIFCTVGEEWGWLGSVASLCIFLVLLAQLMYVSENSKSAFARIFGYCVVSILFTHVAINVAMTIGLAPTIGIPLPFFSYGGSALLSFTIMVFILLNLYANRVNVISSR